MRRQGDLHLCSRPLVDDLGQALGELVLVGATEVGEAAIRARLRAAVANAEVVTPTEGPRASCVEQAPQA